MQNDAKQRKWTPSGAKGCKRKLFSGKTVISLQKRPKNHSFLPKKAISPKKMSTILRANFPLYRESTVHRYLIGNIESGIFAER